MRENFVTRSVRKKRVRSMMLQSPPQASAGAPGVNVSPGTPPGPFLHNLQGIPQAHAEPFFNPALAMAGAHTRGLYPSHPAPHTHNPHMDRRIDIIRMPSD